MKRFLIALMCVAVVFCYVPTMAFADQDIPAAQGQGENLAEPEETEQNAAPTPQAGTEEADEELLLTAVTAAQDIYVSGSGSDETGNGSETSPYATLAKAAAVVNADLDTEKAFTIHVMSDLEAKACARFYDHNVTIIGEGNTAPTVSRGENFAAQQDNARSAYNPAMIEIQTAKAPASLTLKNIILDDRGLHGGTVFAQAISKGSNEEDTSKNSTYVQDAIIASNATRECTITLGEGTVLRNYGGMSAVRVTNQAVLKMEAGSAIEDTTVTDRTKGNAEDEVGPAGAVWTQGGALLMEAGAEIRNMIGRAIYADGGNITIGGKIYDITSDADMWQGDLKENTLPGVALHLRNSAVGSIKENAVISDLKGGGSAVAVLGCDLNVEKNTLIKDLKDSMTGIADSSGGIVYFDGEITGMQGSGNALNIQKDNFNVTIGPNAWIHDNHTGYGTIYSQGTGGKLHIYGKINNNIASDRGGGLAMANNFGLSTVTMYDGAEICNNYSAQTGGGVMVSVGTFIMKGGKISNNIAKDEGGGVYVRRGGTFILEAGTVADNQTRLFGGGIAYEAENYNGGVPCVELDGGSVSGNKMHVTITEDNDTIETAGGVSNDVAISNKGDVFSHITRYLSISDKINLSDKNIYVVKDNKTITPAADSLNLKLGNASVASSAALETVSNSYGWSNPLATYWMQRDSAARMTVGGLTLDANAPQIVYAIAIPVDASGNPEATVEIQSTAFAADHARIYNTKITESGIEVTIPEGNSNGYAVALVQPTQDFGSLLITTTKAQIDYDKDKTADGTYEVPYTASYTMSDNLLSLFEQAEALDDPELTFTLTLELDKRLTVKEASDCKFTSPILEAEDFVGSADGSTVTVRCKLKAEWRDHLAELAKVSMVLTGTGVLDGTDFAAGEILLTTGNVQMTIPYDNNEMYPIYIPGNVCQTKMVKEEVPVGPIGPVTTYYTIKATAGEGGSIAPNGYVAVSAGSDKSFAITAADGYEIKDVLVDGVSVGAVSSYVFKNVWKDHTIDAVFQAKAEEPETPDKPVKPEKPSKPETPDKPTKPEQDTKVPKTGDNSALAGSALLLLLSACGLAAALRRKEEK